MRNILVSIFAFAFLYSQGHWETAISANDQWYYLIPENEPPSNWNDLEFTDSSWSIGPGGFGYGDNDDGTVISQTISVYLRKNFIVHNLSDLSRLILHADYDDGFIAYLNGMELARSENLGNQGTFVSYDQTTNNNHEALLYLGDYPDEYFIDSTQLHSLIHGGENVLAVQVHNVGISSSDMSSNFYLSFWIKNDSTYYGTTPDWFREPFVFTYSNLPIVIIDTDGQEIVNSPRIIAHMGIIDNLNSLNHIDDAYNGYDGQISIEIRGSSSQMFPKKQYALETQDDEGENSNVSILGMPEENDWILHAPYSDKSLIRNFLAYELARSMGRYSSRTRFCELLIDGDYKGLYIFMEKIKRDNQRVDISKLNPDEITGDDLTGGYIIKVDKWEGDNNEGWLSVPPLSGYEGVWYQYHYPKPQEIAEEQKNYIINYINEFEAEIANSSYNDPDSGYYNSIDLESFIDVSLMSEISKNVDAYRLSSFMYKDKDSESNRLTMGPIWDYNLSFGNADYYDGENSSGWQIDIQLGEDNFKIPFWWYRIWDDTTFQIAFNQRWQELRQTVFSDENIMNKIDSATSLISEAQSRNFIRWPILDQYVWPNAFVGGSYDNELNYLRGWILERLSWMDGQVLMGTESKDITGIYRLNNAYPNPFNPVTTVNFSIPSSDFVNVKIYDIKGREIKTLVNDEMLPGDYSIQWNGKNLASGIYFIRMLCSRGNSFNQTKRVLMLK